jgi:hypothetical protein
MNEKSINYDEMDWEEATGYPTGTKIKILREENGAKTFLLNIPAEFDMEAHCHTGPEQHFVLEGEYQIEHKIYNKGFYRFIPAGVTHGPFLSRNGAIILVIWDPY